MFKNNKQIIDDLYKRKHREKWILFSYIINMTLFILPLILYGAALFSELQAALLLGLIAVLITTTAIIDYFNNRCPICDDNLEKRECITCKIIPGREEVFNYLKLQPASSISTSSNKNFELIKVSRVTRCEVCHQQDMLDQSTGYCQRCHNITQ